MKYKKNCLITQEEYNKLYQQIYYFKNRNKLLAHAKRDVTCEVCGQIMPYSSYSYHSKNHELKKSKLKTLRIDSGKFILTFD